MKQLTIIIAAILVICSFTSCDAPKSDYSPMDSYINAELKNVVDSINHANEVRAFQDSMSRKYPSIK